MKWRRGGWERVPAPSSVAETSVVNPQRPPTMKIAAPERALALQPGAVDLDFGVSGARWLMLGGGISGFLAVVCAAILTDGETHPWIWLWQIVSGAAFLWFVGSARASLRGRGLIVDRRALWWRAEGTLHAVPWQEIGAVGISSRPLLDRASVVRPDQRIGLEVFPADPAFPARYPQLDQWRVDEPPPREGLPATRYRFPLPPAGRLPGKVEDAVQDVAANAWVGRYRIEAPISA
ncbi:hypothetical protein [Allokutzneria albata]|uniref:hypothetical protein n=1 Tax=Allokutzneria albata TaxID=211114 RepID=UPI0012DD9ADE|nr:hypothetical protein [Allokutzneria albata]